MKNKQPQSLRYKELLIYALRGGINKLRVANPLSYQLLKFGASIFLLTFSIQALSQTTGSQTFNTSGANTFTTPAGITKVAVEAWGGGGGGGGAAASGSTHRAGGGGGGGAYIKATGVTVGASVNFTIGAGGTAGTTSANGGNGGATNWPTASPTVTGDFGRGGARGFGGGNEIGAGGVGGTGTFNGGSGASATGTSGTTTGGGGGGGGAGSTGNGGIAVGSGAGPAGSGGGGIGGAGSSAIGNGSSGAQPGGGGGGGNDNQDDNGYSGGAGMPGKVIVSWVRPSSSVVYSKTTVKNGDSQTITVTFSEPLTGTPTIVISGSSTPIIVPSTAMSGGPTVWTYSGNTVWPGDQTATVTVGTATGSAAGLGNVVDPNPTSNTFTIDNTAPTFTSVLPNPSTGTAKIGDVIQVNFTAGGAEATLVAGATLTVNGVNVAGTFTNLTGGNYRVSYTVASGNTDRTSGTLPLSLQINDAVGNTAVIAAFTAANTLVIDANAPTFTLVAPSPGTGTAKIGDVVQINFTAGGAEATLVAGAVLTVNGVNVAGTFFNVGGGNYRVNYTVASGNTDRAAGTLPLSLQIKDVAGNAATISAYTAANTLAIDANRPIVSSIALVQASPTNLTSLDYTVVFNEGVTGVDITDFLLSGTAGGTINSVVQNTPSNYTVNINPVTGQGTLRLDVKTSGAGATITDIALNQFQAGFTTGSSYTVDTVAPAFTVVAANPNSGVAKIGDLIQVNLTEGTADATLLAGATLTVNGINVAGSFTNLGSGNYRVTYTVASGNTDRGPGAIPVNIQIKDPANNVTTVVAFTDGNTLAVDANAPTFTSVLPSPSSGMAKIGDVIQVNLTAGGAEATLVVGATLTVNGIDVKPTFTNLGAGNYRVNYTVGAGQTDRAAGTLPISLQINDAAGNTSTVNAFTAVNTLSIDANAPAFTSVLVSPSTGTAKVGDVIQVNLSAVGAEATLVAGASLIVNGVTVGTFTNLGSGNYRVTYTVANGQTDRAAGSMPISLTINDTAGNSSTITAFTAANSLAIDANRPIITQAIVAPNVGTVKVGSTVTVTIHASSNELGLLAGAGSTINGVAVTGSFASIGGGDYNFTYIVGEGNPDWAASTLPINLILADAAGNLSSPITTFIGSSCAGDANTPAVPSVPDLAAISDSGISNTDNYTSITSNLQFGGTAEALSTVRLYNGVSFLAQTSANGLGNWSFLTINLPNGIYNINATSTDAAGNISAPTANLVVTVDTTPPTVSSIVVNTVATPINAYSSTVNGITTPPTNTVTFRVTFSENVYGLAPSDFFATSGGPTFTIISLVAISPSQYDVTVNGLSGAGTIQINFTDSNSVIDQAGNLMGGPLLGDGNFNTIVVVGGNQYFTLALPEPSGAAASLNFFSATATSISVSWPDVAVAQQPTHYLVMLKKSSSTFVVPTDGTYFADDTDLTNGDLKWNIAQGTGSTVFSGLSSGVTYNLIIYPYTLSPNDIVGGTDRTSINYFTGSPAATNGTTTTAAETTLASGTGVATISSLDNTAPQFKAVFQFTVKDDGANPLFDDADFKFSSLVLNQDIPNGNTIANWSQAFSNANARLSDNAGHSQTANITVNPTSVVITSIPASTIADLGFIPDNGTKIYTLEIFLNSSLGGTLPQTIDGSQFVFNVNDLGFVYNNIPSVSSRVKAGQTTNSGPANNVVSVVATQLVFAQQPPSAVFALSNLSPIPQLRARDVNGNTDRNFGVTLNITNSAGLPMTQTLIGPDFVSPNAGVYTFPAGFQYTDAGAGSANNGTLTLTNGLSATSTNVTVTFSNTTTILAGAFIEPATFSSLLNDLTLVNTTNNGVFDFNITDDNGAGGDGAPTRLSQIIISQGPGNQIVNWTQAIADAVLYDGITQFAGTVNTTNISFTGMANTNPGDYGYVADNAAKNFRLLIRLKSSLGGALPSTIDNLRFSFQVLDTDVTLNPISSKIFPGQNQNSGSGNNAVDVLSTELRFTNPIGNPTLVNIDISTIQTVPAVEATDNRGNRDLNYNSTTIVVTDNNGRLMLNTPGASSLTAGLLTFANNFRFTTISSPSGSSATLTVSTSTLNAAAGTPTSAVAGAFEVKVGTATTITAGAVAPATISSLVNISPGVAAFSFNVNDDQGAALLNNDGVPTLITGITITPKSGSNTVTNWSQAIAGAILTDGVNSMNATIINPTSLVFNSISTTTLGLVGDNATKNYTLRIWLNNPMLGGYPSTIDGLAFGFEVLQSNVVTSPSTAIPSTLIIPSQNTNSGAANVVTVVATALRFLSPAGPSSATLNNDFSPVVIEAVDANNNRDLSFTGAGFPVASVGTAVDPTGANLTNQPAVGTQFSSPSAGLLTFATNFQFSSGAQNDNVTLTVKAGPGPGTTCGVNGIICGTSPTITLQASFESSVVLDPTYVFPATLEYVNRQEPTNITTLPTAIDLARFLLVDGDRTALGTQPDNDGIPNADKDGASTKLNSITFRITNPSSIRRIALYSGAVELQELDATSLGILSADAFHDFTFTGAPLVIANDNNQAPLTIRVSFRNNQADVRDRDQINVSVVGATLGIGSNFFTTGIAGLVGGARSPIGPNVLDVVATKLDFIIQPGSIAGINEPVPFGTLEAHDQFGLLDVDFNASATATAAVPISFTGSFTSGKLSLATMLYSDVGDGTVTVTAGGITSNMTVPVGGLPNTSVTCNLVNVVHVSTSQATGGVITSTNLIGGTTGKIIYGVTFRAATSTTSYSVPGSAPYLNGFTISFSNSVVGVLQNFKVYESADANFSIASGDTDVTMIGGTVSNTAVSLIVDFGSATRDLTAGPKSYFLQVDVNSAAVGTTPPIQPDVVDNGFGTSSHGNIVTSKAPLPFTPNTGGSHTSSGVSGQTYTFASIFPPILTGSNPFTGQLNVDPARNKIDLTFSVPVWTLDGVIKLYDQTNNNSVVTCTAINGAYAGGTTANLTNTVTFNIPIGLIANHLYYVTIAPGNLSTLTGLMDQANNLFQGFTYSGTLYFKVSNPSPPVLLGANTSPVKSLSLTDPNVSNISLSNATINATFDQQGTAYFLVLKNGAPVPTNAQIKSPGVTFGANLAGFGSFQIIQTNGISQFGIVDPTGGQFAPSQLYNVWMYAENNALPAPFSTFAPYGAGPGFLAGAAGPTLTFTTPASNPPGIKISAPNVRVCNNSYQTFNAPIIVSEGAIGQFSTNVAVPPGTIPTVTMNIGLPAGFQFDVSKKPSGVPNYGTLTLVGADFTGTGTLGYLGNSILTISYKNNSSTSLDKIIISGLRVLATSSSSGSLFRIGGTALTGSIPDGTIMGTLLSFDSPVITFDNTYSSKALGNTPTNVVTSIPDNGDDLDPSTAPGTIQLKPYNTNASDFGPNNFNGQGVNINLLTLSAVSPDVPFNITITHTDNNGCISQNPVQYTVYNHTTAINMTLAAPPPPTSSALAGGFVKGPFCVINTKFVNSNQAVNPPISPALGTDIKYMAFNNLVGYKLRSTAGFPAVTAKIPTNATSQIINGPAWAAIVAALPLPYASSPQTDPLPGSGAPFTESFYFDAGKILDANAISLSDAFPGSIPDPYNGAGTTGTPAQNFRSSVTAQGNYYHTGGSLGIVEFTGIFQSVTNATVIVPRTQVVEYFVPAVPLVEIGTANRSYLDVSDGNNPVGKDPNDPARLKPQVSNTGTPVFCTAGGLITVSGYPAASVGSSVGSFKLEQAFAPFAAIPDPNGGFVDNGNGTATIDPTKLNNSYADIRITYTYKENASPCSSFASQMIRITPNPLAGFSWTTSPLTSYVSSAAAQCAGQAIKFVSTASIPTLPIGAGTTPPDPTASITLWSWNFGDISSSTNVVNGNLGSGANQPSHTFVAPSGLGSPYRVTLTATSNYGCASVPAIPALPTLPVVGALTQNLDVGGIPVVKYKLDGVSTSDMFRFNSNDTQVAFPASGAFSTNLSANNTTVSGNDFIARYDWSFGDVASTVKSRMRPADLGSDAAFNNEVMTFQYTVADIGPKQVDLKVTSNLGCVNSLGLQGTYRSIVVLDRQVLNLGGVYVENFNTSNANWQVWGTGKTTSAIAAGKASASWAYGPPASNLITPADPLNLIAGNGLWKTTNLNGNYNPGEKSALYSPSFDLTSLTRPMVSFNSVIQIERSDGVVLEYSKDDLNIADPNKQWLTLGVIADGQDWYTDQGIAGRPGTQIANDFGWSGSAKTTWQSPKHILDPMYTGLAPSKAVFRLALGSAAPKVDKQGFAFDNFRVGDRTRTILLENFVNTGNNSPNEKIENNAVANFISGSIGTEVVKINYHVGFPGKDPFNEDNPSDPSSRALYYNIVQTPRSTLDGELDSQDRLFSAWGQTLYNLRTLQLAQADIAIQSVTKPDGSINVSVDIKSQVLTGIPAKTILHVALVEQTIPLSSLSSAQQAMVKSGETTFDLTLKKMLPSAAGTPFGTILPYQQTRSFGPFVWNPDPKKLYQAPGDLAVAVFLQQEDAPYEVYQVEIKKNLAEPPVVTGLEPGLADEVKVYPVPANHELHVVMPGMLVDPAPLELIDQTGRSALQSSIPAGESKATLNVTDLASGVYILQINVGNGNFTRKRVMVVRGGN